LVRWSTRLHDQFMLPEMLRLDFADVLESLSRAGYPLTMEFFHPHFEFRFPVYGTLDYREITLELRQALEPWHVLGEEPGGGGTVRFVDSSVERLQVKVSNMTDSRHIVTCNGRRVPLQATGTEGTFAAGIRYRAWQPPSCLHPTIGVHAPLTIDLYDTWTGRAVAGCTYHVGHPGGRNYETFPVNSYEADGRRNARFIAGGHSPGFQRPTPPDESNPAFPYTLDLRRGTR